MSYCVEETDKIENFSKNYRIEEKNSNILLPFLWKNKSVTLTEIDDLMPFSNTSEVYHIIFIP